jgi:SMI1 / KNR4 family (SUKH-1)
MDDIVSLIRKRLQWKITDRDEISRPKPLKPAQSSGLAADEENLGFRLPPLLKRIYIEIGNGGFGPGCGLIGMSSGVPDSTGKTAPEIYRILRSNDPQDPSWSWPFCRLPICEWGCAIISYVDCAVPDFPVGIFDPNVHNDTKSWDDSFFDEAKSFEVWIKAWADGSDLWQELYGETGRITRILTERKEAL